MADLVADFERLFRRQLTRWRNPKVGPQITLKIPNTLLRSISVFFLLSVGSQSPIESPCPCRVWEIAEPSGTPWPTVLGLTLGPWTLLAHRWVLKGPTVRTSAWRHWSQIRWRVWGRQDHRATATSCTRTVWGWVGRTRATNPAPTPPTTGRTPISSKSNTDPPGRRRISWRAIPGPIYRMGLGSGDSCDLWPGACTNATWGSRQDLGWAISTRLGTSTAGTVQVPPDAGAVSTRWTSYHENSTRRGTGQSPVARNSNIVYNRP